MCGTMHCLSSGYMYKLRMLHVNQPWVSDDESSMDIHVYVVTSVFQTAVVPGCRL